MLRWIRVELDSSLRGRVVGMMFVARAEVTCRGASFASYTSVPYISAG